jgi:hypothetical protein
MDYWTILNWDDEASPSRRAEAAARQRTLYPPRSAIVLGSDAAAGFAERAAWKL